MIETANISIIDILAAQSEGKSANEILLQFKCGDVPLKYFKTTGFLLDEALENVFEHLEISFSEVLGRCIKDGCFRACFFGKIGSINVKIPAFITKSEATVFISLDNN